jgi:hypothetical protein
MSSKWPFLETLLSGLIGFTALAAGVAPLAVPSLLVVTALVALANDYSIPGNISAAIQQLFRGRGSWAVCLVLLVALASATWARQPWDSVNAVLRMSLVLAATFYVCASLNNLVRTLDPERQSRFTRALPIGMALVAASYAFDLATHHGITLLVANSTPWIFAADKTAFLYDRATGMRIGIRDFYFIRNAMATAALLPSLAASLSVWPHPPISRWLQGLGLLITVWFCYSSGSETSLLALSTGLFFFALAQVSIRSAILALQSLLVALALFAIPLAMMPKALNLDTNNSIPQSFRQRVTIWNDVAHIAKDHLIYGIGVKSIQYGVPLTPPLPPATNSPPPQIYSVFHPHNGYLQVWVELGAVGALLFCTAGIGSGRCPAL